ncbi:bifunctional diguanylate cyclase/phosphodiesterase (plasmid) [Pontibacillus sp. ALD_SL1]|uniref:sensor domain-containing protein n=1 Tax=Pontibacillus sp. ALD_SL1 TaxID=2777185 RepID=UPI001A96594C|nr:bifunctional diguanylate cyclase/phosphodiesterase [Pontibacillus sp. ALD_SL1]QST02054.1 bifunctional diguanylate cyclase/phosphodiesterase [Pontibacillus sp. ALD_SL1]
MLPNIPESSGPLCVAHLNKNKEFQFANSAFLNLFGCKMEDLSSSSKIILADSVSPKEMRPKIWEHVEKEGFWEGKLWTNKPNGDAVFVHRTIVKNPTHTPSESYSYILIDRKTTPPSSQPSYIDPVTNLPHRQYFHDAFVREIHTAKLKGRNLAAATIDIDRFRSINESFGYSVGDQLLKDIALRIKSVIPDTFIVSRLGGDKFIILMPSIQSDKSIIRPLEKVIRTFKNDPFLIDGNNYFLSISIGVSVYPHDGTTKRDLIKAADLALYQAKEYGGSYYQFYKPHLNVKAFEQFVMETNIVKAIHNREFVLYYQPQVSTKTGEVLGFEALIRWDHPEYGLVPPGRFIGIAEETGLIKPIGNWVLFEACRQAKRWQDEGYPPIKMAVNLSLKQFNQKDLAGIIKKALRKSELAPSCLEIELTESISITDFKTLSSTLEELHEIGVSISIDDFGTGYSSLGYLGKLPWSSLKIDRSFIKNITVNENDHAITSSIMAMAKHLGLEVIAEGAETLEHVNILKELGCPKYQGFYFSPPVPAEEAIRLIQKKQ